MKCFIILGHPGQNEVMPDSLTATNTVLEVFSFFPQVLATKGRMCQSSRGHRRRGDTWEQRSHCTEKPLWKCPQNSAHRCWPACASQTGKRLWSLFSCSEYLFRIFWISWISIQSIAVSHILNIYYTWWWYVHLYGKLTSFWCDKILKKGPGILSFVTYLYL